MGAVGRLRSAPVADYIECGHKITWRWKSVGQDGAFCRECQRVFPVRVLPAPPSRRVRIAKILHAMAERLERR